LWHGLRGVRWAANTCAMKHLLFAMALTACASATAPPQAHCTPAGLSRTQLEALKASDWTVSNDAERNALARALTDCLGDPDPALRDGLAFEGLQHFLRQRQLSNETMRALLIDLEARLTAPEGAGFERPFAALALAEVARTDRVETYLTSAERAHLLDVSIEFLVHVRDYRGFDEQEGWRHGVAHGSDLMLQLVLNPAFGKPELTRIRDAIAAQLAPPDHFYIYGESLRLAQPILYMARRDVFSEDEWTAWFSAISGPGPLGTWDNAFNSQAALARRHNLVVFVTAIYALADASGSVSFARLLPGARAALAALP
jgi:Protein of unknown function (DUF2785)